MRRRLQHRGIGTLEVAVALIVISVLLYFLLAAVHFMQERGEKAAFDLQRTAIEAGLRAEAASRQARGLGAQLADLERDNPLRWLETPPPDYRGEFPEAPVRRDFERYWYYDTRLKELAFVPKRAENLKVSPPGPLEVRLKVVTGERASGKSGGVVLVPTASYVWFGNPL